MTINREHILQVALVRWVREAVAEPHEFLAFDRSKAAGQWSHMREKARGVRAGTPDTILCLQNRTPIWAELKAPGNKPTPEQAAMADRMNALGHHAIWVTSVLDYLGWMRVLGVRMHANAEFLAMQADAGVASKIAKAEAKAGKPPKSYKPVEKKPTAARIRKIAAARRAVMF